MPRAQLRGGIDVGGTKIQAAILDRRHRALAQARRPTPTEGGPRDVIAAMAEALGEAAQLAGVETASLAGVGVGSPGTVDARRGTVSHAGNLPDWQGTVKVASALARRVGTTVLLGNDVQVATDAEYRLGAGKGSNSLLGVFWGTGVGGGIVLDGKAWAGRGAAGEIGHVVVRIGGKRCGCGRRGCMEAYAGRASMERIARHAVSRGAKTRLFDLMEKHDRTRLTSGIWARALDKGDKLATEIVDEAIEALGAGVASVVNVLDVDVVVIGGGLGVRFGAPYAERIAAAMQPHLFNDQRPPLVRTATLGDLGGAIGAAMLLDGAVRPAAARPRRQSGQGHASAGRGRSRPAQA